MNKEMKIRGKFPMIDPKSVTEPCTGLDIVRTGFDNFKYWDRPLLCQEKKDGWFGIVEKENDQCRWTSGKDGWKSYSKLQEALVPFQDFMPNGSKVVCEVMYGTPAGAKLTEKLGYVQCVLFDVLKWDDFDSRSFDTKKRFEYLKFNWDNYKHSSDKDNIIMINHIYTNNREPLINKQIAWNFFKDLVDNGGEGIVLKDINSTYEEGTETEDMWKVKNYIIKSYILLGFEQSTAETYNEQGMTVSSIVAGLFINGKLKEVTKTSGFNFEWRKKFSDNPSAYIGRVIDIGGFEVFKTGAMRHSSFLWFRPDVDHHDCII